MYGYNKGMRRSIRALCMEVDGKLISSNGTALWPGIPTALGWCARDSIPLILATDQRRMVRRTLLEMAAPSPTQAISAKLAAVVGQILIHAPLAAILVA